MGNKRSFIELINRKPGSLAEYLPKTVTEAQQPAQLASQENTDLASQNSENWQAFGLPKDDWQAKVGLPKNENACQTDDVLANQKSINLASQNHKNLASQKPYIRRDGRMALTVRYAPGIYKDIKDFCTENNVNVQDFCEAAASCYLNLLASQKNQKPASQNDQVLASWQAKKLANWQAHDDLMISTTHDDIIMLYKKFTKRKWTASDDRAARKFNDTDRRLIEIGMIQTIINARGKKINSFAYFIPEIQVLIDLHASNQQLDVYLLARRDRLNKWLREQGKEPMESK